MSRSTRGAARGAAKTVGESNDFSQWDDPAFLAERRRVREELERMPPNAVSVELSARYQALDEEFVRRARIAWAPASYGGD
jgi:hypothetical protein